MSDNVEPRRLLQALNDEDASEIRDCLQDATVTQWINNNLSIKDIVNPRGKFSDSYEYITCLGFASRWSNARIVRHLVEAGADVTVTDSARRAPLPHACESNTDVTKKATFLLDQDCLLITVSARNNIGCTPLIVAAFAGNRELIPFCCNVEQTSTMQFKKRVTQLFMPHVKKVI